MTILDRYITSQANRTIGFVVTALLCLISLFTLLDELGERQEGYGLLAAGSYVLKTMPRRLDEILVYGLFLGYLITLGRLAETNELTICRVCGMSPWRLCRSLTPSMLLWMVLSLTVSEYVAPGSERIAEMDKMKAQYGERAFHQKDNLWLRDQNLFMRVRAIDDTGKIWGIEQYWLNQDGVLVEVIHAQSGIYAPDEAAWHLDSVTRKHLGTGGAEQHYLAQWNWESRLTPSLLAAQAYLKPHKMSLRALHQQIGFARDQNAGVSEYEIAFWSRVLKPLTFIGMTLFALGVVLGPLRQVTMGLRLTFGIFAGLGFKYLQDLFAPACDRIRDPRSSRNPHADYFILGFSLGSYSQKRLDCLRLTTQQTGLDKQSLPQLLI